MSYKVDLVMKTKCDHAAADRTTAKADVILYTDLEKMFVICIVNGVCQYTCSLVEMSHKHPI